SVVLMIAPLPSFPSLHDSLSWTGSHETCRNWQADFPHSPLAQLPYDERFCALSAEWGEPGVQRVIFPNWLSVFWPSPPCPVPPDLYQAGSPAAHVAVHPKLATYHICCCRTSAPFLKGEYIAGGQASSARWPSARPQNVRRH